MSLSTFPSLAPLPFLDVKANKMNPLFFNVHVHLSFQISLSLCLSVKIYLSFHSCMQPNYFMSTYYVPGIMLQSQAINKFPHDLPHKVPFFCDSPPMFQVALFYSAAYMPLPSDTKLLETKDGIFFIFVIPSVPSTNSRHFLC